MHCPRSSSQTRSRLLQLDTFANRLLNPFESYPKSYQITPTTPQSQHHSSIYGNEHLKQTRYHPPIHTLHPSIHALRPATITDPLPYHPSPSLGTIDPPYRLTTPSQNLFFHSHESYNRQPIQSLSQAICKIAQHIRQSQHYSPGSQYTWDALRIHPHHEPTARRSSQKQLVQ